MRNLPSNESVGANFSPVFSLARSTRKIFVWELLGPHARAWGSLGLVESYQNICMLILSRKKLSSTYNLNKWMLLRPKRLKIFARDLLKHDIICELQYSKHVFYLINIVVIRRTKHKKLV